MKDQISLQNKPRLKVYLADFLSDGGRESPMIRALSEKYEVEISNQPDVLFCSYYGQEHWRFSRCIKVFWKDEVSRRMPRDRFDYVIGYVEDEDTRHFYWDMTCPRQESIAQARALTLTRGGRTKFSNFIYSQDRIGDGAALRKEFCQALSQYKRVDCPGRILHNMEAPLSERESGDWHTSKVAFISDYKFTIAFENTQAPGYHTEKLWDPLTAGSIPVYWGDPVLTERTGLNPEAIIDCTPLGADIDAMVKRVMEIDRDEEAYLRMLNQPLFIKEMDSAEEKLKELLWKIAEEALGRKERGEEPFSPSVRDVTGPAVYGFLRPACAGWEAVRKPLGRLKRGVKKLAEKRA